MGSVALVGAGPGAPGLITVRARECLERADVLIYDRLVNPEILSYAAPTAERICVGRKTRAERLAQDEINDLLIAKACAGLHVVRLKGGDPFVFGRGGEEAVALRQADVPLEIVPGVTAGIAAPAYAGIPVTHRSCNSVLTFITGHEDSGKTASSINWAAIACGGGTLVFYMGIRRLVSIADKLMTHGRNPRTPAAVIRRGTEPDQRTVTGTLGTIAQRATAAGIRPPAIIVIGDAVALHDELNWYTPGPLAGKTVMVTRPPAQAYELVQKLRPLGARVLAYPTIRIAPPETDAPLVQSMTDLDSIDWILFTSTNAVGAFFRVLGATGRDTRALAACRIGAVGSATTARLREQGITPDLIPPRFTSTSLCATLTKEADLCGKHVLLPRADIAPADLPRNLRQAGAVVTTVAAYRTIPETADPAMIDALDSQEVDVVIFTSASTARCFAAATRRAMGGIPEHLLCITIGPQTSRAATGEGLTVVAEATPHTTAGLVAAVLEQVAGTSE